MIDAVCDIVRAYRASGNGTGRSTASEYLAVHDAEQIAVLEDRIKNSGTSAPSLSTAIDDNLLTDRGRSEAQAVLQP
jgi:hypothetical protein